MAEKQKRVPLGVELIEWGQSVGDEPKPKRGRPKKEAKGDGEG